MKFILSGILFTFLFITAIFAQLPKPGMVSGFIYDKSNREALIGVNVYIPQLAAGSATNTSGYYIITDVAPGEYDLVVEYIGYETSIQKINVKSNVSEKKDVYLSVGSIMGETVEVVADSVRTVVKLYDKPISQVQLNTRQIRSIPQVAEADLLRSLQTLPGILPVSDFSSALYVRGGTPDQNLYLLDGTDVYNPEHAFGIFSTFNTDAIKHVDLSKGGFGATYGGRLSSVMDVINYDGNREEFEGSASISLLSAKTNLQMPVGNKGAISGSIRRTYFDKTVAKAVDEIPDYYFYDGNIKGFYEIDHKNKITISGYGGRDFLDFKFDKKAKDATGFKLDWGNKTGSIRWTRVFNPKLFSNFWITGSRFSSDFDLGETIDVVERNFVSDITFKGNLEYHHSKYLHAKFGFEQKNLHVLYRETFPDGKVDVSERPEHYVAYSQFNWRPSVRWDIAAGLRYNYFSSGENFQDFEPRFSAKYRVTETINLKAAAGVYKQYMHHIPRTFISDIWTVSNEYQEPATSRHLILGVQKEVASDYQFEFETYYKEYDNIHSFNHTFLTELNASSFDANGDPIYSSTKGLFHKGDGNSYGFETMFRKEVGLVTGWVGYTFAETKYEIANINNGLEFSPRHDRRHTLNLVSNIDLKNIIRRMKGKKIINGKSGWTLGVNFVYSSGQPLTVPGSVYLSGLAPNAPERFIEFYPSNINTFRLPAYARLDLSLTYRRKYKNFELEPYLQVFNAGNRKNVWFLDYNYENGVGEIETMQMFPMLPTVGVNITF